MNSTQSRGPSRRRRRDHRPHRGGPAASGRPQPAAPQGFFDKILALFGFGKKRPAPAGQGSAPRPERRSPSAAGSGSGPRPAARKPEVLEVTSPRLYVGNLSYDASESDLFELFNGVGQVQNAEVVTNRHTQRSKGFAFVQMASVEEAKRAVEVLHDKEFMGRKLLVSGAKVSGSGEN